MKSVAAIALAFGLVAVANASFDNRQKLCDACVNITDRIHDAFADPNFRRSLDIVLDVQCLVHKDVKRCTDEVDDFVTELQNNLTAAYSNPVKLCTDAKLCKAQSFFLAADGPDQCDQCIKEITEFENKIFSAEFQANVTSAIEERFCNRLPGKLAEACRERVDSAVQQAIDYLKERLGSPREACQRANLCPQQEVFNFAIESNPSDCYARCNNVTESLEAYVTNPRIIKTIRRVAELPCNFVTDRRQCIDRAEQKVNEFVANLTATLQQNGDAVCQKVCGQHELDNFAQVGDFKCFGCQVVEKALYNAIQEGKTEAQIEADVGQVCQKLPAQLQEKCVSWVNDNLHRLFVAAQQSNGDAKGACIKLGDCTNDFMTMIGQKDQFGAVGDFRCFDCQLVEKILYTAQQQGKTEAEIEQNIDQFCAKLPAQLQQKCIQVIDQKLHKLWVAAQKSNGDAKAACVQLGDCTADFMSMIAQKDQFEAVGDFRCFGCQVVEKALYNAIQEGKTEAQIEADVGQVCQKLPAQLQEKCVSWVNDNLHRLFVAAQQSNGDAKGACIKLGDCTADFFTMVKDEDKCQMCRDTLQDYQTQIQQNAAELTQKLQENCENFGRLEQQCRDAVAHQVPYLAHYLTGLLNPNTVCPKLHFC